MLGIPEEMETQIQERMKLISALQSNGAITTPVSYLETPVLLVMHMDDAALDALHKRLKKTRVRFWMFGLNGRMYAVTRRESIAIVREEMVAREEAAADALL